MPGLFLSCVFVLFLKSYYNGKSLTSPSVPVLREVFLVSNLTLPCCNLSALVLSLHYEPRDMVISFLLQQAFIWSWFSSFCGALFYTCPCWTTSCFFSSISTLWRSLSKFSSCPQWCCSTSLPDVTPVAQADSSPSFWSMGKIPNNLLCPTPYILPFFTVHKYTVHPCNAQHFLCLSWHYH